MSEVTKNSGHESPAEQPMVDALGTQQERLHDVVIAKLQKAHSCPSLMVEFDPDEADYAGAVKDDSMSTEDALDSSLDFVPEPTESQPYFIPESEDSKGIYHPPTTHIRTQQASDLMDAQEGN